MYPVLTIIVIILKLLAILELIFGLYSVFSGLTSNSMGGLRDAIGGVFGLWLIVGAFITYATAEFILVAIDISDQTRKTALATQKLLEIKEREAKASEDANRKNTSRERNDKTNSNGDFFRLRSQEEVSPELKLGADIRSDADALAMLEHLGWTIEEKDFGWSLTKGPRTLYARRDSDELINLANSEAKSS
jgi:hypothetical protein